MIEYIALILGCQLVGEFIVVSLNIPIPGPVIGMLFLFAFLIINGSVPKQLDSVSSGLLSNLSLMFVPAGVGVMTHLKLLETDGVALLVSIVVSTALTIAVTAWLMQRLAPYNEDKRDA